MTTIERQRRSRDRALEAWALRAEGLTFREIGERMGGVTYARAEQMVNKGARWINFSLTRAHTKFRVIHDEP